MCAGHGKEPELHLRWRVCAAYACMCAVVCAIFICMDRTWTRLSVHLYVRLMCVCACALCAHVQDMDKESDLHLRFRKPHFDINHGADKPRLELRKVSIMTIPVYCINTTY
jgi:hypothetical protein